MLCSAAGIRKARGYYVHIFQNNTDWHMLNTFRPRQNGRHFADADDIIKCIFLNENVWISIEILLKFVSKGPINNIPAFGSDNG